MAHHCKKVKSPVGELTLIANEHSVVAVLWENDNPKRVKVPAYQLNPQHPLLREAARQLDEYFSKERTRFEIPFEFYGTDFHKRVWKALSRIPHGETRTYAEIAAEVGSPKAVRAVGAANGRNPISIIVPCHRVIGTDGSLTGFAGGLEAKRFLLALEERAH